MYLNQLKDIAIVAGVIITLFTFIKGTLDYSRQGAQKRAEMFVVMRRKFTENNTFIELCALIETDELQLVEIPFKDKRNFLGFFEEIALMTNSNLIRKEVAHYMFGYYAIRCWESKHFWNNINRSSEYWSLFKDFVEQMTKIEQKFQYKRRKFRL